MSQVFKNSTEPWGVQVIPTERGLMLAYPGASSGVGFQSFAIEEKARTYRGQHISSTPCPERGDAEDQEAAKEEEARQPHDEEGEQESTG